MNFGSEDLDGVECGGIDLVIEARGETHGAQHAEFVFFETAVGIADGADDSFFQVVLAADEIENLVGGGIQHHAVDGEVAALRVFAGIFGEADFVGMAAIGVAEVGTEGGDFDRLAGVLASAFGGLCGGNFGRNQDDSELLAYGVGLGEDLHDLWRGGVGGDVEVGGVAAEEDVADAASGEESLVAVEAEGADDFGGVLASVRHRASVGNRVN